MFSKFDMVSLLVSKFGWVKWVAAAKAIMDMIGDLFPLPDDMTDRAAVEAWFQEASSEIIDAIVAIAKVVKMLLDSSDDETDDDFVVKLQKNLPSR